MLSYTTRAPEPEVWSHLLAKMRYDLRHVCLKRTHRVTADDILANVDRAGSTIESLIGRLRETSNRRQRSPHTPPSINDFKDLRFDEVCLLGHWKSSDIEVVRKYIAEKGAPVRVNCMCIETWLCIAATMLSRILKKTVGRKSIESVFDQVTGRHQLEQFETQQIQTPEESFEVLVSADAPKYLDITD